MCEPSKPSTAHVYVIRIWREGPSKPGAPALWRAWVEDARTRQRWGFGSVEAMLTFLRTRADEGTWSAEHDA
jgi:hypothetical protein